MVEPILVNIGLIIVVSAVLAFLARILKQPLLVAYLIAGIVLGPVGLGLITDPGQISALAELGIAFLLFAVGLDLDINRLKAVGLMSLAGGLVQVAATFALGYLLAASMGMQPIAGIYIGMLFAFSSTMIVGKLLEDRNEIRTIHGRIMLIILIVQDIIVIIALPFLEHAGTAISVFVIQDILLKGIGLFMIALLINRFALRRILDFAAKSNEVLFMIAIAIAFVFIGISTFLGFSIAIGGFIAGIALANFPYNLEIERDIHSIKHFFSAIFFATVALQLNFLIVYEMLPTFLLLLLFIMFAKPLILGLTYLFMGYGGRNATEIGLGLGQSSEFMLIIAAQGLALSHISPDLYSLIISVVVISLILTPYTMKSTPRVYSLFSRLRVPAWERITSPRRVRTLEKYPDRKLENHVIIIGCHIIGHYVLDTLMRRKEEVVVVDSNPDVIKSLSKNNTFCIYGDAANPDVLGRAGMQRARMVIIGIPNTDKTIRIIRDAKKANPRIIVLAKAVTQNAAEKIKAAGADYVVVPDTVGGEVMSKEMESLLKKKTQLTKWLPNNNSAK